MMNNINIINNMDNMNLINPLDIKSDLYNRHKEIHIKIQQRNGKKSFTIIEGLDKIDLPTNKTPDEFLNDVSKKFKKSFNCMSTVIKSDNTIKLSGDQRDNIKEFLVNMKLVNEDQIKIHGF